MFISLCTKFIIRSCREFATCYNCLYNSEIGRGCNEDKPGRYTIKGRNDPTTNQRYLMCSKFSNFTCVLFLCTIVSHEKSKPILVDPPGSCKRMRCECDRSLAEKLREYENQWNVQNHRRWGSPAFDPQKYCTLPAEGETFGTYNQGESNPGQFSGPASDSQRFSATDEVLRQMKSSNFF